LKEEKAMQLTRRTFLATAAASQARAVAYNPLLGTQIYVWTQQKATIEEALSGVRRAGYERIELMSQFFTPEMRDRTAAALKANRLEMCSCYHGGAMHEPAAAAETIAKTLEVAALVKPLGTTLINVNPNPTKDPKSDAQLAVQAKALDELGGKLRQRGMRLTVHQHAPEMRDGAREWRHELRHTDPNLVWFCVDVDWIKRGGQDPMTILGEAGKRIASLHVRSARNGVWQEALGDGDVDYRQVAGWLREVGYQGYVLVELAYEKETRPTRSLEENLRRSRQYAESVFVG
jgi:inosose dehydratase